MCSCDGAYYELLGVEHDASVADIKRAFRRRALAVHPDRNKDDGAHVAFQHLRRVHDVLVDAETRALYDDGGEAAVDGSEDAGVDAAFWAQASASVTPEDIVEYEAEYPRSPEEREDLKEHFLRFAGKVDAVVNYIPFSSESDLGRFVEVWDALVAEEKMPRSEVYEELREGLISRGVAAVEAAEQKVKKKKAVSKGRGKIEKGGKTKGDSSAADASLIAMIQSRASQREKSFNDWADSLAEPAPPKRSKRAKKGSTPGGK
jgi:DnaJ homolog subfamily C member 9